MTDIEPIESLAFAMRARPKLYALLLGSGVSKAAGIPTGWEVVLDLVGKLAAMQGEEAPDPEAWHCAKYGSEPSYSELINAVASTQAERQQILREYWAAAPAGTDAARRPTLAHTAIADLVKGGFVKVIVTTNFDRLVENALREAGLDPVVLSSPEDIAGMMPLDHTDYCVIKLHGDYLDERILNTTDELSEYPDVVNDILDRILQDYGLVVCGWSGAWDVALANAIRRAESRRYSTYWAVYGPLGDEAKRMIKARDAQVMQIESADSFFGDLCGLVQALEDHAAPHPLSLTAAVAQCKQFLGLDQYRIRLADHVDSLGKEALNDIADLPTITKFAEGQLTKRFQRYEGICGKLLATAVVAAYWSDTAQIDVWRNTVERLFEAASEAGSEFARAIESYPAVLLTYALAIGAVASGGSGGLERLAKVLTFPTGRDIQVWTNETTEVDEEEVVAHGLSRIMLELAKSRESVRDLEEMERHHVPMNDWLYQSMRKHTVEFIPSDARYQRAFDRTEVLLALGCGRISERSEPWFPVGCFVYRNKTLQATVREIEESLRKDGDSSPYVRVNLLGRNAKDGLALLGSFCKFVQRVRNEFHIWLR